MTPILRLAVVCRIGFRLAIGNVRVRFLFDYATDEGVVFWINKVLKRVNLEPLSAEILDWMPGARRRVYDNVAGLLPQYALEV